MNKTILMFCAVIVFAVFSCDKKEVQPSYLDNKLIEGRWYANPYGDSLIYSFKNNRATYEYYAQIIDSEKLKPELNLDLGNYLINDDSIFFSIHNGMNGEYKFNKENKDSLFIKIPSFWIGYKRIE